MSRHRLPPRKPEPGDHTVMWQRHVVDRNKHVTSFTDPLIQRIRDLAGELGYAIAVHGSLDRDIDLIACPWTADAVDALDLVKQVIEANAAVITGFEKKPHGRLAFTLQGFGTKTIDLSVMPIR